MIAGHEASLSQPHGELGRERWTLVGVAVRNSIDRQHLPVVDLGAEPGSHLFTRCSF